MRLANYDGRATLLTPSGGLDVADASEGRFGPDPQDLYPEWSEFVALAPHLAGEEFPLNEELLRSPVPRPRQVFAVGLNYGQHVAEMGLSIPSVPATFTKFPSSLGGPFDDVVLSGDTVDWEVELVVVLGATVDHARVEDGWRYVAGVTVGQDISDRTVQDAAGAQFSLGKSFRGYGPIGPYLVTPDELVNRNDLALRCWVNGTIVQEDTTASMIFDVPSLISKLSGVCTLWPGDVIFTGTPSGAGVARTPPVFLQPGDVLESSIEGIGTIRQVLRAPL